MTRTRIAVAGAGYIGLAHVAVAQASSTCTLSAIVDPAPAAQATAAKAGVPLYRTLDELIAKDRTDGVVLATPNQLHVEHASICIDAGLPMLHNWKSCTYFLTAIRPTTMWWARSSMR